MLWTLSPGINPGLKALKASHTKMLQGDRFRLHDCHLGTLLNTVTPAIVPGSVFFSHSLW